jgi:putative ABC transport system permease protein
VGLRRSTVVLELLKETLLVGVVGALAGIPLGFAIARAALPLLASTFAITFRGPSAATLGPVSGEFVVIGVGVGLLASLLAAIIPVLRLSRRKPVAALTLRGRDVGAMRQGQGEIAAFILLGLTVVTVGWQYVSHVKELGFIATGLILLAATMGAAGMVQVAGHSLSRVADRLYYPTGEFTAEYFLRQPRRVSTTVATVGIGLGAILMFVVLAWSTERTLRENLTFQFSADFVISSPFVSAGYRTAPLDDDIVRMVRNVPGVSAVGGIQSTDIAYGSGGGIPPVLWSEDPEVFRNQRLHRWRLEAGALPEALNRVADGHAVLVTTTFARRFNIVPGQKITLTAPTGPLSILVAGVTSASPEPAVYISRDQYESRWRDESVSLVLVALNHGEKDEATKAAIMRSIAGKYRVEMRLIPKLIDSFASQVRKVFGMLYLLAGITFVLIVIGVGDTLATEVLERMREFAVLRAVGLRRWRVFEIVMADGLGIGAIGLALAIATGALLSLLWVKVQFPALVEWQIDLYVPWGLAAVACLIMLCVAAVGSLLPSFQAAHVSVRDSLRNE